MKRTHLIGALLLGLASLTAHAQATEPALTVNNPGDRIHIYPNPSRGTFYFNGVKSYLIEVTDLLGQRVYSAEATSDKYPIDLSSHARGIYSYRIINDGEIMQQGKVVVE
jgi:hypothetical protein